MYQTKMIRKLCGVMLALSFGNGALEASTVWNVNVGAIFTSYFEITPEDNYVGAALENTPNSYWNSITGFGPIILTDSTGDASEEVTITIIPVDGSLRSNQSIFEVGDTIFKTYITDRGEDDPVAFRFGNLDVTESYDLVIYSDKGYSDGISGLPVTQTGGSGLEETIFINRHTQRGPRLVGPLLEDKDPRDVESGETNYYRLRGLLPDSAGFLSLSIGGVNGPVNGFQLVKDPVGILNHSTPKVVYKSLPGERSTVTFSWPKTGAASYDVRYSFDLDDWNSTLIDGITEAQDEDPGDGENITVTKTLGEELESVPVVFFRIEQQMSGQ